MENSDIYHGIIGDLKDPSEILQRLLFFNNFLYGKISEVAVQYGKGQHPKHRVTNYHAFFVDNVGENDSVLDLGSGRGDVTYDVAKKTSKNVVGVELSANNVQHAKSKYSRLNLVFVRGNIYTDVIKEHFDVVIMSNVLEHLDNRVELLKSISDKVTPKKILLRIPQFERDWMVPVKKELGVPYFLDSTHKIEYTYREFEEEMEKANLNISKAQVNWGEIWAVVVPRKIDGKQPQ